MSRWKSPQLAARHAQRAAKAAEQSRRENRKSLLLVMAIAAGLTAIMVGDYLWMSSRAQRRREQYLQRQQHRSQTNSLTGTPLTSGPETNKNHE
jgi:hypothetical protein